YKKSGKLREAENAYRVALGCYEKSAQSDPLELAYCLYNLAELYSDQLQFDKARPLYNRAVEIWHSLQLGTQFSAPSALLHAEALTKMQEAVQARAAKVSKRLTSA